MLPPPLNPLPPGEGRRSWKTPARGGEKKLENSRQERGNLTFYRGIIIENPVIANTMTLSSGN